MKDLGPKTSTNQQSILEIIAFEISQKCGAGQGRAGEGRHFVFSAYRIKIVGALDFTHKSTSSNDALLKV